MCVFSFFFFFKQKTAYEMRISDWSSDVCSSDLDGDRSADADLRLQLYAAAMGFDELAGERKAEAQRPLLATARGDGALESVEHPVAIGGRDAPAIVGDGDFRLHRISVGLQKNSTAAPVIGAGLLGVVFCTFRKTAAS